MDLKNVLELVLVSFYASPRRRLSLYFLVSHSTFSLTHNHPALHPRNCLITLVNFSSSILGLAGVAERHWE